MHRFFVPADGDQFDPVQVTNGPGVHAGNGADADDRNAVWSGHLESVSSIPVNRSPGQRCFFLVGALFRKRIDPQIPAQDRHDGVNRNRVKQRGEKLKRVPGGNED